MGLQTTFFKLNHSGCERIGFSHMPVNSRDKLGKIGVAYHNRLGSVFHGTLNVQAQERGAGRTQTLYLNRGSMVKWLNPQLPDGQKVGLTDKDQVILQKFKEVVSRNASGGAHVNTHKLLQHQGVPAQRKLDSFTNLMRSSLVKRFWDYTLSSYNKFRLRFTFVNSESTIKRFSELRAIAAFWDAYNRVPAYRKFIDEKCGGNLPKTFADIPATNKKNYIAANPLKNTLKDARYPAEGQIDTSTGTTGKPTKWLRGPAERETVKTLIHYAAKVVMGDQPFIFINAFALGPWATGMTTAGAITDAALTLSTGPDIEKILDAIQEFKDAGRPYIIAGYPPFVKKLTEVAKEKNINLSQYNLMAIVGGEGMSENLRQRILDGGFKRVFSSYGASDLDINIGYESDFEMLLRRECEKNPDLAKELYGPNQHLPMIFHYDPLNYLIEAGKENSLTYTCVRQDRVSPRIRYELGDEGRVMAVSDVLAILKKYNVVLKDAAGNEIKPNTNLPLIFVWGRQGTAVSYNGAKVAPENLEQALNNIPNLPVENYGFSTYEDQNCNRVVQILIELGSGAEPQTIDRNALRAKVIEELALANQDFKWQVDKARQENLALPELVLFANNRGPMANQDPHRKKQYIYSGRHT